MSYNSNYESLVSKYLEGEMADAEKQDFEHQLKENSALKEEYQFQRDIIRQVEHVRKTELKARLNSIKVPSNQMYQYIGMKTAALVAVTVLIGFGAYYFLDDDKTQSVSSEVDLTKDQIVVAEEELIPEMPEAEFHQKIAEPQKSKPAEPEKSISAPQQKEMKEELAKANRPANIPEPEVTTPDVEGAFNEEEFQTEEDPLDNVNSMDLINKNESEKVEVETIPDGKREFHYQFYNNKLYLYGNFNEMPYEIIEFNANKSKLYYLFYDSTYYSLDNNQLKAAPLEELSDEALINQLNKLRSK